MHLCWCLYLAVHASITHACVLRQQKVCRDCSNAAYPPPPKKRKTPHTQNQTVQKPHHRRLQCPPQLPRCTSPKEIHLANTCRHKHTRGHITTGLLPCLPTSIYTLGPTGTVVVHSAYYRGCMQFKHSTLRVKLIRHTHTCRQTR